MTTYNISGSGSPECHGDYTERGEVNGKPFFNLVGKPPNAGKFAITNQNNMWHIFGADQGDALFSGARVNPVETPDLETWSVDFGAEPLPTVTVV